MASSNIAVFGTYPDRKNVAKAVDALKNAGFRDTDMSVLYSDSPGTLDFGHEKHTKIPEGAATGGSTGSIIGALIGWLAGMDKLKVPGSQSLVAAGPVVSLFAGAGIGGSVGWVIGALVGMTIPEYEAKRYHGRIDRAVLLSVHSDDENWEKRAKNILKQTGAEDIGAKGEAKAA